MGLVLAVVKPAGLRYSGCMNDRKAVGDVAQVFDSRAGHYHEMTSRGWLGALRRRESAGLFALLGEVRGLDLLELGCGAGYYTRQLVAHGAASVTAVDLSPAMVAALPAGPITGIAGDAAKVDAGRRFPRVVSAGMLEFVPDPAAVLVNARRHVAEDGFLVVLLPRPTLVGRLYQLYHRRNGLRIRLFSPAVFAELAARSGWRVEAEREVPPFTGIVRLRPA